MTAVTPETAANNNRRNRKHVDSGDALDTADGWDSCKLSSAFAPCEGTLQTRLPGETAVTAGTEGTPRCFGVPILR